MSIRARREAFFPDGLIGLLPLANISPGFTWSMSSFGSRRINGR